MRRHGYGSVWARAVPGSRPRLFDEPAPLGRREQELTQIEACDGEVGAGVHALAERDRVAKVPFGAWAVVERDRELSERAGDRARLRDHHPGERG
jgi:hypothetical protein